MVNAVHPLNMQEFRDEALSKFSQILRETGFITIERIKDCTYTNGDDLCDREILLKVRGKLTNILVEEKRTSAPRFMRDAVMRLDVARSRSPGSYPVLFTSYISPESASICKQYKVGYLDLAGNCHLAFDEVYIHQEGFENPFKEERGDPYLFDPKGERVLRALLDTDNAGRKWRLRDVVQEARPGVSLGHVHKIVTALCNHEYVKSSNEGFTLVRPEALLIEWSRHYRLSRSTVRRFHSLLPSYELGRSLTGHVVQISENEPGTIAAFASFSAAARIQQTEHVRQHRHFLYLKGDLSLLIKALSLEEVDSGENIVVYCPYDDGVFYHGCSSRDEGYYTCPVQTYVDLQSAEGRGPEAAEYLLDTVLRKVWGQP